jgi:hypothetical protein
MTAHKKNFINKKVRLDLLLYFLVLIVLSLSAFNIHNLFAPEIVPVLGASTEYSEADFWRVFLSKNKNYIPGWIEVGRIDIATQINPHYFTR